MGNFLGFAVNGIVTGIGSIVKNNQDKKAAQEAAQAQAKPWKDPNQQGLKASITWL